MTLKEIEKTSFNRKELLKEKFYPKDIKKEINEIDILIIPYKKFRDRDVYYFSEETLEFFYFLKQTNLVTEICIDDENLHILQLHSDEFRFSHMLLTEVLLPVFSSLITEFISTKIKNSQKNDPQKISVELTIEKQDKNINLKYAGPVDGLTKILKEINEEE